MEGRKGRRDEVGRGDEELGGGRRKGSVEFPDERRPIITANDRLKLGDSRH